MNARVRTASPVTAATLKRSPLPCVRSEMALAQAGFAAWPLERPAARPPAR